MKNTSKAAKDATLEVFFTQEKRKSQRFSYLFEPPKAAWEITVKNKFFTGRFVLDAQICGLLEVGRIIMKMEHLKVNGTDIAVISSEEKLIVDTQSALDLAMTVKYETGATNIVIDKTAVCKEFFILSSGMAGEILQKFINYHVRIAIYGDYSQYTSKPLKDFIYESNNGNDFFFVSTKEEAIRKLIETQ